MSKFLDQHAELLLQFLAANMLACCGLLVWELWARPKSRRTALIVLLVLISIPVVLQNATGYYFVRDSGGTRAHIAAVLAYVALMLVTLSGRKMAWRLNRILGVVGLGMPIIAMALSPGLIVLAAIVIFGISSHKPVFEGRISPGLSWDVIVDPPWIGNASNYRYEIFRTPEWFPSVRKRISTSPIDGCEVPALRVRIEPDSQEGFVRISCQQSATSHLSTKIAVDTSAAAELKTDGRE